MQLVSLAFVCVLVPQAANVFAHPAAPNRGAGKSVSELHEEFTRAGTQLQADLKTARARADWKADTHVQALLNAIQEADKIVVLVEKDVMDPKHPMSQSEAQKLANDLKAQLRKIESEGKQLKPEQTQNELLQKIGKNFARRFEIILELMSKQGTSSVKQFSGISGSNLF